MKTPDLNKEDQKRAEIITAAQKIFQVYGLEKTTMDDIASAVGMGKSSLYYYFKSKEDVFYAVAKCEMEDMTAIIRRELDACKTPSRRLKTLFVSRFYALRSKLVLYPALLKEHVKHLDLYQRIMREANNKELEVLKRILADGVRCGEFKSIKEDECDSLAVVCMMVLHGMDAEIVITGQIPPESLRLEAAAEIFIRGLK